MAQASSKPVKVFRFRGLSASIFENHSKAAGPDKTFFKVSLQRSYRDGEEWKQTSSLGRDDLPIALLLLQRSWEFIIDAEAEGASDGE